MSTGGLGLAPQGTNFIANLVEQKLRVEQAMKGGASWFIWAAALSLINSTINLFGGGFQFIFGLGLTQVVDAFAHQAGGTGMVLDLIINGFVAGLFVLFWNFARKGQKWAFLVGMAVYLVDGLILLAFKDFLGAAFHGYVLFRIYQGMSAIPVLQQIEQATVDAGGPIQPQ